MTSHVETVLLFYFSGQTPFVAKYRAQMVTSMFFLITCDQEMITDISSIQFRLSFTLKNHIQLHNENWNPKVYVSRKPCSHPLSTAAWSSMRGGTMKWTRSELCRQQCTSKDRTIMGWYVTDNPKVIVHITWFPWQLELYKVTHTQKWKFLPGKFSYIACNQPRLSIVACITMLIIINDPIGTALLFYSRNLIG